MSQQGRLHSILVGVGVLASLAACDDVPSDAEGMKTEEFLALAPSHLPNNFPILNGNGFPDYNGDGYVDAFDYDDFVNDFFTGCG